MTNVRLGRTEIIVEKNAFGALPVQRVEVPVAVNILRKAYDHGIRFFDTARGYTDSEEKLGLALADVRDQIILATKTPSKTVEGFWSDLATSLKLLKTDYIDIFQFHNPNFCPLPGDGSGLYEAMLEAKAQGKIRHIGITNHRLAVAKQAVESGLYDTLQFPFSYLASQAELDLVNSCKERDIGFIAMKALSGGLIRDSRAAYAFMAQFDHVLPIWGVQHEHELDEFISYIDNPPALTPDLQSIIDQDVAELTGSFCRGCGYCMPCPVGIEISLAARMSLMLRRAPVKNFTTPKIQENMKKIEDCLHCDQCKSKCPYSLDIPSLLAENYEDFKMFIQ